jgi:hypothetical protein
VEDPGQWLSQFSAADQLKRRGPLDRLSPDLAPTCKGVILCASPSEVGLNFEREGMRMKLKSRDYTIIIESGFSRVYRNGPCRLSATDRARFKAWVEHP